MGETYERAAPLTPADYAVLGVEAARTRAASYPVDDHSPDAQRARSVLTYIEQWEKRRRNRAVRLWHAVIETHASALDEQDASIRLTSKVRHPIHWIGDCDSLYRTEFDEEGPLPPSGDDRVDVSPLRPDELDPAEQDQLTLDYPRHALTHVSTRRDEPDFEAAHIMAYVQSLQYGSARLRGALTAADEDEIVAQRGRLPKDVVPTFWRSWQTVDFLAGIDEESARHRAEQLASTIVDFMGRPVGRVIDVIPNDGDMGEDELWLHPGRYGGDRTDALFDDYDLSADVGGETERLADLLDRTAADLHKTASTLSYPL